MIYMSSARRLGVETYVATQLLTSMQTHPVPSLSEVHALFDIIGSGVAGVQLSDETVQGAYPVPCVELIRTIERQVEIGRRPGRLFTESAL